MSIYRFDTRLHKVYDQMFDAVDQRSTIFRVPMMPISQALELYKKAVSESKYGYLYQPCSVKTQSSLFETNIYVELCPEAKDFLKTSGAVEFEIEIIAKAASKARSTLDKVRYVHQYFVQNYSYAYEHMGDIKFNSALSAFLYREAVCEGFALAYACVLNRMGIPCGIVTGESDLDGASVNHAWNIVNVGDYFYHCDVTWDICTKKQSSCNIFDYCLISDSIARLNHVWSDESVYPCSDSSQDSYARAGFVCRNTKECIDCIVAQLRRKSQCILFRCSSPEFDEIVNSLVLPELLFSASKRCNISVPAFRYSYNANIGTVTYYLN